MENTLQQNAELTQEVMAEELSSSHGHSISFEEETIAEELSEEEEENEEITEEETEEETIEEEESEEGTEQE
jgi:hypothetical protein